MAHESLDKTMAIVLCVHPYSNTSHVVSWLTADRGRMVSLIKGACRPKSQFLGQYDLFYSCELVYYTRERGGVCIAREITAIDRHDRLRDDWRAAMSASYAAWMLDELSEHSTSCNDLYRLFSEMLDSLSRYGTSAALLLWFETRLLAIVGLSPDWRGCGMCRTTDVSVLRFSISDGKVVCPKCHPDLSRLSCINISSRAADALEKSARITRANLSAFADFSDHDLTAMRRFMGLFINHHLGLRLDSRAVAWNSLSSLHATV